VGVGVCAFPKRALEYFFPIFDTGETVTSMQKALTNKASVCVTFTSVTDSQNVLPSLSSLSAMHPSDNTPEDIMRPDF
jgi:hypothetical protein